MKTNYLFLLTILASFIIKAQATIKGRVQEQENQESVPFAVITLENSKGKVVMGTQTNFDGLYELKNAPLGSYVLKASFIGYKSIEESIIIDSLKTYSRSFVFKDQKVLQEVKLVVAEEEVDYESNSLPVFSQHKVMNVKACKYASVGNMNYYKEEVMSQNTHASFSDNTFKKSEVEPLSTFSIDVDNASYSMMRRYLNEGNLPPADAIRVEEMINYFNYDYKAPEGDKLFNVQTTYTDCPWSKESKLVHIGMKAKEIAYTKKNRSNLVFLLDVSGSMDSPDKLGLVKKGLYMMVNQLDENDKVSIVVYAGASGVVLKSTKGTEKERINAAIEKLTAGGSTAGGAGINLAYKLAEENFITGGNNRIILASDGDFNVGVSNVKELQELIDEKRKSGVYLTVLGVGSGNLRDNNMEVLADKGNGNYFYIDNALEAKKVLVSELGGTLNTIAKDVKLQVEFNPAKIKEYRLVGYVNRLLEAEDFNDDTKDAGELGEGHTVTAIYEVIPSGTDVSKTDVSELKYTQIENNDYEEELLTVSIRFKKPNEKKSSLETFILQDKLVPFDVTGSDVQFSTAVAMFGMKLRQNKNVESQSYLDVKSIAQNAKGEDSEGYRGEFIRLIDLADQLN